ncbi:hypothetical protein FQA39_LY11646 [Lamprigera yunnana]|nr:hypothetical protein FQA39_LY11646 [Lamprigera yunnana]
MMNKAFIVYFILLNITVVLGTNQTTINDEYKNELQKIFNILFVSDISVNDTNALEKLRVHISTALELAKTEKHDPNEFLDKIESSLEEAFLELKEIKGPEDFCKLKYVRLKLESTIGKMIEEISKGIGVALERKSTGRPTVLTENVIENIQERINRSPKKAISQLSQQTGPSVGTCFKALKRNLHMHPYKVTVIQR